jgi:L-lactate utilization protein LutB
MISGGELRKGLIEEGLNETYKCVHCGFCLPTCSTYRATWDETDSPRGRIYISRTYRGAPVAIPWVGFFL